MIPSRRTVRWLGMTSLLGGAGVLGLMVALAQTGFGEPGTAAYPTYELRNRLLPVPLALLMTGWVGAYLDLPPQTGRWGKVGSVSAILGMALVTVGNGAEFWLYSDLPYTGFNMRHVAWSTFLLGLLAWLVGATMLGMALWRRHVPPRWLAALLVFLLLLAGIGFVSGFLFLPLAVNSWGLGAVLLQGADAGRPRKTPTTREVIS